MDITNQLAAVLKNFASINSSIIFKPGNTLKTINASRSVLAIARFEMQFPIECGIGDIAKLLNISSMFEEPYIKFDEKHLTVYDHKSRNKAQYTYTDPVYISAPPEKDVKWTDTVISFDLASKQFSKMQKALAIYEQPDFVIDGDGKNIFFKTANVESPIPDSFSMEIGETNRKFTMAFARENLPLLNQDYHVSINPKWAHFEAIPQAGESTRYKEVPVEYFVAAKSDHSYFEDV